MGSLADRPHDLDHFDLFDVAPTASGLGRHSGPLRGLASSRRGCRPLSGRGRTGPRRRLTKVTNPPDSSVEREWRSLTVGLEDARAPPAGVPSWPGGETWGLHVKIASVEVLEVGCELTAQHTFVRLTTDSGIERARPVGRLGLPERRCRRARGAVTALD